MRKPAENGEMRRGLRAICVCFFLSGAAGLIYQVAWSKALGLIFGHTAYAIATVLAVFMAGLACGSTFFGRWGRTQAAPIFLYARVELLAAVAGALSLAGLTGVRRIYLAAYPHVGDWEVGTLPLRFVGAALVLFVPTFLMGGTLPILVQGVTRNRGEAAARISQLYWINTLGAVAGTLLCGFVLLPAVGLRLTVSVAAALNVVAGAVAWRTAVGWKGADEPVPAAVKNAKKKTKEANAELPAGVTRRFLLILFAVVGATAFAYEIAWTRLLAIELGSSTYAFTVILTMFLAGAVLGSLIFERWFARRNVATVGTFAQTQTWIGIAAVVALILFRWIPSVIPFLLKATLQSFSGLVMAQLATSALTVLPMATVFGFNFPAVLVLLSGTEEKATGAETVDERGAAKPVGQAYAANTLGAIAGSLVTGFVLVPWLGTFCVIALAAAVNLLLAVAMEMKISSLPRRTMVLAFNAVGCVVSLAVGFLPYFHDAAMLSMSAALYGNTFQGRLTLPEIAATNDVIYSTEGVNDSIAVIRSDNYVALRVNGKVDASTGDARTQLLLGHLGAALHAGAPKRVLIVGFGSGMTVSAVARYPDVEKIDCVEIEPAVVRASPYLESLNHAVLGDPRVNIIFDDARNFLLTSREQYDLIISEPSNPWIAGIATLFTDEFYAAVRQRLAPGGIFVQWVQAYSLAPQDLKMIAATLTAHFPEVTLWRAETPDLLFLARTETSPLKVERLRGLWDVMGVRKDFEAMDVHAAEGLMAYFLLDDAAVRKLGEGSVRNTDDRTLLEYHAPQTLLAKDMLAQNQDAIERLRTGPLPGNLASIEGSAALLAGAETAQDMKDTTSARRFVEALQKEPESVRGDVAEGRLAMLEGKWEEAKGRLHAALKLDEDSLEAMHWLARAEQESGEKGAARELNDKMVARSPGNLEALTDEMEFAADRQDYRIALLAQMARMKVMPEVQAAEYCRLGAIWMKLGNLQEAEKVLQVGLQKDSYSYACNLAMGEIYRETGRTAQGRETFEKLLRWYPDGDVNAYEALAQLDEAMGDRGAAEEVRRKRERVFGGK